MPGRTLGLRGAAAALALAVGAVTTGACGDGRPGFCDDLSKQADMSALSSALESQDLDRARTAAEQFSELAGSAPDDIRSDMQDLADAVEQIVELLAADRNAVPGAGDEGQGDAAVVEQDRDELNRRLEEMATTSSRVERWASRECGVTLH
ncbi:hypothetical protein [Dermatobacter hominis]|uniref:hypothetical protein n=1 Tax=Dermatobacter hominis TaxID=2884263 RepID=UPI001D11D137|nr:hypothetical protein [Dermatobacter hominis]UDY35659.1 hypothetical protein LH044_20315 [Dermatobacter hominis]